MYCQKCGTKLNKRHRCDQCGDRRQKGRLGPIFAFVFLFLLGGAAGAFFYLEAGSDATPDEVAAPAKEERVVEKEIITVEKEVAAPPSNQKATQGKNLTEVIAAAQETVYTILTVESQGSGFLYDTNGHVVTNAHVVEGSSALTVKDKEGRIYDGQVIGYSNETDLAVVRVTALKGKKPNPINREKELDIGEEVISLGSPHGYENTAAVGHITGKGRDFVIEPHTYSNVYQISASISPGSSGGPLVSKAGQVVGINSAVSRQNGAIGFSIPITQVLSLIDSWIQSPMSEEEIMQQFYNDAGNLFYEDLWDTYDDWYFDGGDYSDLYDDYDDESYWSDYDDDWYADYDYDYDEDDWIYDDWSYEEDEFVHEADDLEDWDEEDEEEISDPEEVEDEEELDVELEEDLE